MKKMPAIDLGFIHQFVPAEDREQPTAALLLLHGTGGDEHDLLPLGRELWPGAALLSPRGKILEDGMPRFFRRFAEGVFDVEDLKARTHELATFIEAASDAYGFRVDHLVVVGYSNGANIAASLILLHPQLLRTAVLFRAMVPFEPERTMHLTRLSVFIGAGTNDPIVGPELPKQLATILKNGGADVSIYWHRGGHELGQDDIQAAIAWLKQKLPNGTR